MAYPIDADSSPLADALTKIAKICDESESDPELLVKMLNKIEGLCIDGRNGWFVNVLAAQRAAKQAGRGA